MASSFILILSSAVLAVVFVSFSSCPAYLIASSRIFATVTVVFSVILPFLGAHQTATTIASESVTRPFNVYR
jgi:hypothetical protein